MNKSLGVGPDRGDTERQSVVMVTEKHLSHLKEADPTHLKLAVATKVCRPNIARFPVFLR